MWVISLISQGGAIHAFKPRRSSVTSPSHALIALPDNNISIGTVRGSISCLTRQTCIPIRFTRSPWGEVEIFATRQSDIHGLGAQLDTSSSTWVFPVDTILPMGHLSTSRCTVATAPRQNTKTAIHHATPFPPTCTISEIWSGNVTYRFAVVYPPLQ